MIQDQRDNWLEDKQDIESMVYNFFANLYEAMKGIIFPTSYQLIISPTLQMMWLYS